MAVDVNMKILVVDDYKTMNALVCNVFNLLGFKDVQSVSSTDEAFQQLDKDQYGLVIYDWYTGPMSGKDFFHKMGTEKYKQIPIIVVSGEITPELTAEMKEIGVPEYITKPFNTAVLRKKLEAIFGK
ncbi:MAG: response regulator [Alphaproteobacteria bacterium]|nr:response regulator [Alphaproteobacteria bacterium]